jgi:hypothetical protein
LILVDFSLPVWLPLAMASCGGTLWRSSTFSMICFRPSL